jgi:acyl transferase domain-containing protein/acyl carrier protein
VVGHCVRRCRDESRLIPIDAIFDHLRSRDVSCIVPRLASDIEDWLVCRLADMLGSRVDEIDPTSTFARFGLASIELVRLAGDLEEWLGRPVDQTATYDWPSPRRLARALAGRSAGAEVTDAPEPHARADDGRPTQPSPKPVGPAGARTGAGSGVTNAAEPLAIVGMSCRFPGGADTTELFWKQLLGGVDSVTVVPPQRWDADSHYDPTGSTPGTSYTRYGAFLTDAAGWDAEFFRYSPQEALRTDPQQRLLLELVWEALEDAAIPATALPGIRTGLIVGLMDTGQYTRLQLDRNRRECLADPHFGLGSASSAAAGRIAHQLDLCGPAFTVDTACSSSLVAVHLAAESLIRGETDLAIAAAASVNVHPEFQVQACAMSMLAADGRCKTFDAHADGFALGEGGGVVLLERLSDAVRNRRRIHALLRGSAVNQDGRSNGLTAPNRAAQVEVIRAALRSAGVPADQIGYVEAHGSGTQLGDAIELAALHDVFGGRPNRQPLLVGAVKTNIGHALAGSGMAGLIKTVLALEHRELPPNLHLTRPTDALPQDGTLRPLASRTPLPCIGNRRLAGVSSFGWSGTNAHLVVEQAPQARPAPADRRGQVLLLSADCPEALAKLAARLADRMDGSPELELADVAYTLQTGRTRMAARRALVCHDTADARRRLRDGALRAELARTERREPGRPTVAYLLPGVGEQHLGMAGLLYASDPVFAGVIDHCAELLASRYEIDLPAMLSGSRPASGESSLAAVMGRDAAALHPDTGQLSRADLIHPLVFCVEVALARLFAKYGIEPDALLGYSLGEYTAACLAGVFTLDDALTVVVERARLVASCPAGSMLAVAASEQETTTLLAGGPATVSLAALNGSAMTVVAGAEAAIEAVQRSLTARGVASRHLRTTHAFHSPLLAPVRDALRDVVASVRRHPNRIPIVSNVTGDWLTPEQVCSPDYWADHLCMPVRFAAGARLLAGHDAVVELGPGSTLGSLMRQYGGPAPGCVLSTLPSALAIGRSDVDEWETVLESLGRLWELGADVDWGAAAHAERRYAVRLPTYPFQRTRFWPDPGPPSSGANGRSRDARSQPAAAGRAEPSTEDNDSGWCYVPRWTRGGRPTPPAMPPGDLVVFCDALGVGARLAALARDSGMRTVEIHQGGSYRDTGGVIWIDAGNAEHYRAALDGLASPQIHVVHAWGLLDRRTAAGFLDHARAAIAGGFGSLLLLAQAVGERLPDRAVRVLTVSAGSMDVVGDDAKAPEGSLVHGLGRVLPTEYPTVAWHGVDLDDDAVTEVDVAARQLFVELAEGSTLPGPATGLADGLAAWRHRRRWQRSWQYVPVELAAEDRRGQPAWRADGTYLITGGTRGLGMALAKHLAGRGVRRLALVSRTPLADRPAAALPEAVAGQEKAAAQEVAAGRETVPGHRGQPWRDLDELRGAGVDVLLLTADAGVPEQLRTAVRTARAHFGALHGIVHCAGVPGGGLLQRKELHRAQAVLAPKVLGTATLLDLVEADPAGAGDVELLVLYSSAVTVLGGLGEGDYCAANTFLDTAAATAVSGPTRVVSIAWGPWRYDAWQSASLAGMPELADLARRYRDDYGISDEFGTGLVDRILDSGHDNVLVLRQSLPDARGFWAKLGDVDLAAGVAQAGAAETPRFPRPRLRAVWVPPHTDLERQVAAVWERYLGIGGIGVDDPFFDLGGNSLIGTALVRALGQELGRPLAPAVLYEHPTVAELSRWLTRADGRPRPSPTGAAGTSTARGQRRRELRGAGRATRDRK